VPVVGVIYTNGREVQNGAQFRPDRGE